MAEESAQQIGRIIYVEPSQANQNEITSKSGVQFPPDYSDMNIAVNLFVTVSHRFKRDVYNGTSDDDTYVLSWVQRSNSEKDNTSSGMPSDSYVSFMRGSQFGNMKKTDPNYLSTYYTDINYEDLSKDNIVEGLGIKSIQIAFESFYTTRVTITFVDVRGFSIFGREEAIHQKGRITADNIFGCFFTFPYPRFRLQVKGFYGEPVTYQLTCIRFGGQFNSSTGNFEATATFMSYAFSLFTDIPFKLLCCAPYVSTFGRDYWDSHKNTAEWMLCNPKIADGNDSDTIPMVTIKDFVAACKTASDRYNKEYGAGDNAIGSTDTENSEAINSISKEKSMLQDIINKGDAYLDSFIPKIDKQVINNGFSYFYCTFTEDGEMPERAIFTTVDENHRNYGDILLKYINRCLKSYESSIKGYNEKYPSNSLTTMVETPLTNDDFFLDNDRLFSKEGAKTGIIYKGKVIVDGIDKNLIIKAYNGNTDNTIYSDEDDDYASIIYKKLSDVNDNSLYSYISMNYCYGYEEAKRRLAELDRESDSEKSQIYDHQLKIAKEVLPFIPCIGNVFKMIIAHFVTFLHIMFKTVERIKSDNRTSSYLGIKIDDTDIDGDYSDNIPPFPGVFSVQRNGNTPDDLATQDLNMPETYAWVGDFSTNFFEEKVVKAFMNAFQLIDENSASTPPATVNINGYPVAPWDYHNGSIWDNTNINDPSSLAGYLGIRATQIIGIMNAGNAIPDNILSQMARMDAYSFVEEYNGMDRITTDILDKLDNTDAAEAFIQAALCSGQSVIKGNTSQNGVSYQKFEFAPNNISLNYDKHGHQPIFVADGSNYKYSYVYAKDNFSMVPSRLLPFMEDDDSYKSIFKSDGNKAFIPPIGDGTTVNSFLHSASISLAGIGNLYEYINESMFSIVDANQNVQGIYDAIVKLQKGKVSVNNGIDDFSGYIGKYISGVSGMMGFYGKNIPSMVIDRWTPIAYMASVYENSNTESVSSLRSSGVKLYNVTVAYEVSKSKLMWPHLLTEKGYKMFSKNVGNYDYFNGKNLKGSGIESIDIHEDNKYYTLFGHPFYYIQNHQVDNDPKEGNVRLFSKCFLFVSGFRYSNKLCRFLREDKMSGSIEMAPIGYLLLIGAILWRKRYIHNTGKDPILYTEASGLSYKNPGLNYTLIEETDGPYGSSKSMRGDGTSIHRLSVEKKSSGKTPQYIPVSSYVGSEDIDYYIENYLIKYFKSFATNIFLQSIIPKCELKSGKNKLLLFGKELIDRIKSFNTTVNIDVPGNNREAKMSEAMNNAMEIFPELFNKTSGDNALGYSFMLILYGDNNGIKFMFDIDSGVQNIIVSYYFYPVYILDGYGKLMQKGKGDGQVHMLVSSVEQYIRVFTRVLLNLKKDGINKVEGKDPTTIDYDRDIARAIYYTLKNIHDRWLVAMKEEDYTLPVYFKNFKFIDSFYRNAYTKLIINADVFNNAYTSYYEKGIDGNMYEFMSYLIQNHQCLLFGVPNFLPFEDDDKKNVEVMKGIFKPIPYNEMRPANPTDTFVIIYVHRPAQNSTNFNDYKVDGFDIWGNNGPDMQVLPQTFKYGATEGGDSMTSRYGYNVPSFGVSFGSQNQSYFTDIQLNMDNPLNTDAAINALTDLVARGKDDEHKRAFIGQDLYSVFSNLSYTVMIRMMGDAQIQPLMYFQLLNIPMWRGTYMTYAVVHNIDDKNNMFTEFKGIKLSRKAGPWPSRFFLDTLPDQGGNSSGCSCNSSDGEFSIPSLMNKIELGTAPKTWNNKLDGSPNISKVNPILTQVVDCLKEAMTDYGYELAVSSAYRPDDTDSQHRDGNAIDLVFYKNGKKIKNDDACRAACLCAAMAYYWYGNQLGQILVEYDESPIVIKDLHLSVYSHSHEVMAFKGKASVWPGTKTIPQTFEDMAKKFFSGASSIDAFRKVFRNYASLSNDELIKRFGAVGKDKGNCLCPSSDGLTGGSAAASGTGDDIMGLSEMAKINNVNQSSLRAELMKFQQTTGIPVNIFMAVSFFESTWDRKAENPNSSAHGLIGMLDGSAKMALEARPNGANYSSWKSWNDESVINAIEMAISYFVGIKKAYGDIPESDMGFWTIAAIVHGPAYYWGGSGKNRLKGLGKASIQKKYMPFDQYGIKDGRGGRASKKVGHYPQIKSQMIQIIGVNL